MSPESKLLLDEMNRLFAQQKKHIDAHFTESDRKLEARFADSDNKLEQWLVAVDDAITMCFAEVDDSITKRFSDSDLNWERRITDSEVHHSNLLSELKQRQDSRLLSIEQVAGTLESWRQESEGAVDDLRLKMTELTKYWDRSVLDHASTSMGLISSVLFLWSSPPSAHLPASWWLGLAGTASNRLHGWMELGEISPPSIPQLMVHILIVTPRPRV